ncbi:D-hexose-6-phosphate mutarotase [Stenotrophomonas mori]|uniref:Putative glucose-6-phosphate 1-epimerase n=1 Tax=Stenotrophomonas mori TaxID=2871096 RepID=A0ABT0SHZ1_9GAMM|nr:D-hexose-6-phosphate mutarotase [Stenotrophomonas mori]MCL7714877.1 D-hexose-6-phosphate mutarotase [Stenotrophomonas mori]
MKDVEGLSLGELDGFSVWRVTTPFSTAAISLFGGQLLSFAPRTGDEVMWLSPAAKPPPTPIRGGTPVCWPYFARQGQAHDAPSHGFVRTLPWELREAQRDADGSMRLRLAPPVIAGLSLHLVMSLYVGRTLEQELLTENVGRRPVHLTQALHNYFRVGDALATTVEGLEGLTYLDKLDGGRAHVQQGTWRLDDPRDPGRCDRIYTGAGGHYVLRDPVLGRRIAIRTQGSRSAVLWNPGEAAARAIADIGAGWRDYLCVEAGNVGPDEVVLAPGARHCLRQEFRVEPL